MLRDRSAAARLLRRGVAMCCPIRGLNSADAREGIQSFIARRSTVFQGRGVPFPSLVERRAGAHCDLLLGSSGFPRAEATLDGFQ